MRAKKPVKILLFLLALYSIFNISRSVWRIYRRGDRLMELRREIENLKEEKKRLQEEIVYRQSPEFIEKEARDRLNMVKEGERVVILPAELTPPSTKEKKTSKEVVTEPNWKQWWDYWLYDK